MFAAIADLGSHIADALFHAHQNGVIHRDVKPANILMDLNGKPWLTDFGLAIVKDNPGETQTGDVVGTLRYMSPEQASGRKFLIDHRTDIYSLGITLYELISLQKPFTGANARDLIRQVTFDDPPSLRSINRGIPEELEVIVSKAIAKNPIERYATAGEFADDLRRFAEDRPILARRANLAVRLRRWVYSHQTFAASAVFGMFIALLTMLVASGMIVSSYNAESAARLQAEQQVRHSEGLRMAALSALQLPENPGQALVLAMKGHELNDCSVVNSAILKSLEANHEEKTLFLRETPERTIDISADGSLAVTTAWDFGLEDSARPALVIDLATGKIVKELSQPKQITSAVFHPDSRHVLTSAGRRMNSGGQPSAEPSDDEPILLWSLDPNVSTVEYAGTRSTDISENLFSADGRLIVLPSEGSLVTVFKALTGERLVNFGEHKSRVLQAVISRDGRTAASTDSDGVLSIWDAETATLRKSIPAKALRSGGKLQFSPDGQFLVVSIGRKTSVYSVTGESTSTLASWNAESFVMHPAFNRICSFSTYSNKLSIRDLNSGAVVVEHRIEHDPTLVRYLSDGSGLLLASEALMWTIDEYTGKTLVELQGHQGHILDAVPDPTGRRVVSVDFEGSSRIWSLTPQLYQNSIKATAWANVPSRGSVSLDGSRIIAASDVEKRTFLIRKDTQQPLDIGRGQFHEATIDGERIALFDGSLAQVLNVRNSKKLAEHRLGSERIFDAIVCGELNFVLLITEVGSAYRWNIADHSVFQVGDRTTPASSWFVTQDGKQIVLGLQSGVCEVFDTETGVSLRRLRHPEPKAIVFCELDAKGTNLVTIDSDSTAYFWAGADDAVKATFRHDECTMNDARLDTDRGILIGYDRIYPSTACCWNLETGALIHSVKTPGNMKVDLHPVHMRLGFASITDGASMWNLEDGSLKSLSSLKCTAVRFVKDSLVISESGTMPTVFKLPDAFDSLDGAASLRYFDVLTGEQQKQEFVPFHPARMCVCGKGSDLCVSGDTWNLWSWDMERRALKRSSSHPAPWTVVLKIPGQSSFAAASSAGTAQLLDVDGTVLKELVTGASPFLCGAVSTDGKLLALGDLTGTVRLWEISTATELPSLEKIPAPVRQLDFNASGTHLTASSTGGHLFHWDLRTRQGRDLHIESGIFSFQLSPDGTEAFCVLGRDEWRSSVKQGDGEQQTEFVRDNGVSTITMNRGIGDPLIVQLGAMKSRSIRLQSAPNAATIHFPAKLIATAFPSGKISLTDVDSAEQSKSVNTGISDLYAIAFSEDGKQLAAFNGKIISLRNLPDLSEKMRYELPTEFRRPQPIVERQRWTPFCHQSSQLVLFGDRVQFIPTTPSAVAEKLVPRSLSSQEMQQFEIEP